MTSQTHELFEHSSIPLRNEANALLFFAAAIAIGAIIALTVMLVPNPILAVLLLLAVAAGYIVVYQVEWALVGLAFMIYTNFSDIVIKYHGAPSVTKFVVPVLLLVILMRWALGGPAPQGWFRTIPFIGIWFGLALAGMLYAANHDETLYYVNILARNILIALTIVIMLNRGEALRKTLWGLLIAGIFLGTISVIQYLRADFANNYWGFGQAELHRIVVETNDYRITGPIGDPNSFAQLMLVLVPIGLERMLHERNLLLRVLAGWATVVTLLTVIFTFSRGAFIGLCVIGILLVFSYVRRITFIPISILLFVIIVQAMPAEYTERISTITNVIPGMNEDPVSETSLRGRSSEAQAAWMMFREHPLFGVGLGNYNVHYLEYSSRLGLDTRRLDRSAHSLYLETLAEMGIFGLLGLLTVIGGMLYYLNRAHRELSASGKHQYAVMVHGLGIGIIGYLVAATFLHDAYPRFFWLLVGICFALPEVVRYEKRENE